VFIAIGSLSSPLSAVLTVFAAFRLYGGKPNFLKTINGDNIDLF
jgi:hypothetical protein